MRESAEIGQFILEHYPPYRDWDTDVFYGWVDWHNVQGLIGTVLDDDDTLLGVSVCRPVMKPGHGDDLSKIDPEGSCIFVDVAIALKPFVLEGLILGALKRFGMRDWIAWKRAPYYVTEFHDAHRFKRIALRRMEAYGRK